MKGLTFYFFIGTTAELIKMGPLIKEFQKRNYTYKIIASGQNTLNLNYFKPLIGRQKIYYQLMIKQVYVGNFYMQFIIWTLKSFGNFILFFKKEFKNKDKKKTYLIVQGDTVSALLGALIAWMFGIRLAHIESGLRSFSFLEPFPEEVSRVVISKLARIHFCPNDWSARNLANTGKKIVNTHFNTLIESSAKALRIKVKSSVRQKIGKAKYFMLVLHRQEHLLYRKNLTKKYISTVVSRSNSRLKCVFVLHQLTEDFLRGERLLDDILKNPHIIPVSRMPYFEFSQVLAKAEFVATDGGSNQEEAYYMGVPCLILRNVTERIEGLGENAVLAKSNTGTIDDFINNYRKYRRKPVAASRYPSRIIADYLGGSI